MTFSKKSETSHLPTSAIKTAISLNQLLRILCEKWSSDFSCAYKNQIDSVTLFKKERKKRHLQVIHGWRAHGTWSSSSFHWILAMIVHLLLFFMRRDEKVFRRHEKCTSLFFFSLFHSPVNQSFAASASSSRNKGVASFFFLNLNLNFALVFTSFKRNEEKVWWPHNQRTGGLIAFLF